MKCSLSLRMETCFERWWWEIVNWVSKVRINVWDGSCKTHFWTPRKRSRRIFDRGEQLNIRNSAEVRPKDYKRQTKLKKTWIHPSGIENCLRPRWKCLASCCSRSTGAATLLGLLPMTLTHTSGLRLFFTAAHCASFQKLLPFSLRKQNHRGTHSTCLS